ncbi:hypothetical protein L873DRAFT_1503323 [Choiromyces venosus 120613-1]|uniref:Uncharacterized protein n=1 Tax=Choiromyces venosus 120613-1 TaxID=1336337 RepID=A0A3N4J6C0_9PEZI|nr:hypothetical protein L873DRAFT_1503323 [Choiromyces venosus 120613-1]
MQRGQTCLGSSASKQASLFPDADFFSPAVSPHAMCIACKLHILGLQVTIRLLDSSLCRTYRSILTRSVSTML